MFSLLLTAIGKAGNLSQEGLPTASVCFVWAPGQVIPIGAEPNQSLVWAAAAADNHLHEDLIDSH